MPGSEAGMLNASYPHGGRPARPFPYWAEVWPGLEYTAAIGYILDGRLAEAESVVADVRQRSDSGLSAKADAI